MSPDPKPVEVALNELKIAINALRKSNTVEDYENYKVSTILFCSNCDADVEIIVEDIESLSNPIFVSTTGWIGKHIVTENGTNTEFYCPNCQENKECRVIKSIQ